MGRSTVDIPTHLLAPDQKRAFSAWLRDIPIPDSTRRALIKTWKAKTGRSFTHADYVTAGGHVITLLSQLKDSDQ